MARKESGYCECKCRDCMEIAICSDVRKGAYCEECREAGCHRSLSSECQSPGAYGGGDIYGEEF